jgi:hypothetical protein
MTLLLLGCAVLLCPWMVVLALTLPPHVVVQHWSLAWLGLDAMEACGLAATGFLLQRHDRRLSAVAGATAALLVMDAWFDITMAPLGLDLLLALILAGAVELPLATLCTALAWRASRRRARRAISAHWRSQRRHGHRPRRQMRPTVSPAPAVTTRPKAA